MTGLTPPPGGKLSARLVEEQVAEARRAREMGMLGYVFGSKDYAPTYIAGMLSLFFGVCTVLVIFVPLGEGIERRDAIQTLGGFLLGSLGYLFGSLNGNPGGKQ